MEINAKDLRRACDVLFDNMRQSGLSTITVELDHYWHVASGDLCRFDGIPPQLDVGQLSEDWEELQTVEAGEWETLAHDLEHLSGLIRGIAETLRTS